MGTAVGLYEGRGVGCGLGRTDGARDAFPAVGTQDGDAVVGILDIVGRRVGAHVGVAVGAGVGVAQASSSMSATHSSGSRWNVSQ